MSDSQPPRGTRRRDLAVLRLRSVLRSAPEPVLFARVKLAVTPGLVAGASRSAVAQVNADMSGRLLRAQGVAENMRTASELMRTAGRAAAERRRRPGRVRLAAVWGRAGRRGCGGLGWRLRDRRWSGGRHSGWRG
jgi:hypothetical protein